MGLQDNRLCPFSPFESLRANGLTTGICRISSPFVLRLSKHERIFHPFVPLITARRNGWQSFSASSPRTRATNHEHEQRISATVPVCHDESRARTFVFCHLTFSHCLLPCAPCHGHLHGCCVYPKKIDRVFRVLSKIPFMLRTMTMINSLAVFYPNRVRYPFVWQPSHGRL